MSLTLDVDLSQINSDLASVTTRARDLTPANKEALVIVMADVDQRFASSPSVTSTAQVWGGVQWERLTDQYLKRNPRRVGGQQLRDTGELLQSFQVGQSSNATTNNADGWTFGSALTKARGLNRKRPLIFYHPALIDVLTNLYTAYIIGDLEL